MLKALIFVRFASLIGSFGTDKKGKKVSPVRAVLLSLLLVYCVGVFVLMFASSAAMLAPLMIPLGYDWLYFALFGLISFSLVFLLSILETKSQLFECKDNELLMSMPIPYGYILISRIVPVVILNVIESFVVLLPALVVYLIFGGTLLAIPGVLVMGILLPVCGSALSSFLGYLVAFIAKKVKSNSFITLAVTLAFIGVYFLATNKLTEILGMLEGEDVEAFVNSLAASFTVIRSVGEAFLFRALPLLLVALITLGAVFFAYVFLDRKYFRLISIPDSGGKKRVYCGSDISTSSPVIAMAKKEFSRLFSSSAYMLNGGFGAVVKVIAAVALIIKGDAIISAFELIPTDIGDAVPLIMILAVTFLSSVVTLTSSAVSLEGKSFWIIKSSPVRAIDILHAKLIPHLCLSVPTSLVLSVAAIVSLGLEPLCIPFVILLPIIADFIFAVFGLVINVAFPKFDFSNDAEVVKQSLACFISTLAPLAFAILLYSLGLVVYMLLGLILTLVILSVFFVLLLVVLYLILSGPTRRRLEKLGV